MCREISETLSTCVVFRNVENFPPTGEREGSAPRFEDGRIPAGTARVLSTSWTWEQFWPQKAFVEEHIDTIRRRVLWVSVTKDLRRKSADSSEHAPLLPQSSSALVPSTTGDGGEEDVFGLGGGLD